MKYARVIFFFKGHGKGPMVFAVPYESELDLFHMIYPRLKEFRDQIMRFEVSFEGVDS